MTALVILIPAALCLGTLALIAFMLTLRAGQYDDLEGTAARILLDDDDAPPVAPRSTSPK
jgi:cbb3-type cytochrome oxidase maturation protein